MYQIRSYPFKKGYVRLETKMAEGAIIFHANYENGTITIFTWEIISIKKMETRKFIIMGSGDTFEAGTVNYISSIKTPDDGIVHLFEQQ